MMSQVVLRCWANRDTEMKEEKQGKQARRRRGGVLSSHTETREELAAARFVLAAGENRGRKARRGEICSRRRRDRADGEIAPTGFKSMPLFIFSVWLLYGQS